MTVIFSDEKILLNGPDGCSYYWHQVGKYAEIFSKTQRWWRWGVGYLWYGQDLEATEKQVLPSYLAL